MMDYFFIDFLTKMLIIFQIAGEFEIANRSLRRIPAINQQPVCLRTAAQLQKKNSFLWNIDNPAVTARRETGKPAIRAAGDAWPAHHRHRPTGRLDLARSYFFGTIHVPYSQVWDYVSPSTKQAFQDADHVIFELDLTNRKTVQALTACQILPDKQSLSDVLPADLFGRLKDHLDYVQRTLSQWTTPDQRDLGLYAEYLFNALTNNWERKRPIWVLLMLNSLTESEVKSRGVPVLDLYLAQEASRQQKQTGAVERVEEQCQPLNEMDLDQVIFALDQSLLQREKVRNGTSTAADHESTTSTEDLVYHYNCGDLDSVIFKKDSMQTSSAGWTAATGTAEMESVDEYFRTELIQKRNRRMAKRVIELLEAYPKRKFFFAFGAGHFLGNHSVIDYMVEMGYNITHLPADYQIKRSTGKRRNRQRNTFFDSAASPGLSSLNRWGSNEQFLPDTDRILANLRSDYVDDRAYDRDQRRKQLRTNAGQDPGRRLTTPKANRNYNELWIRQNGDTTSKSTNPGRITTTSSPQDDQTSTWSSSASMSATLRPGVFIVVLSHIVGVFLQIFRISTNRLIFLV